MQSNELLATFTDELKGIQDSMISVNDRIKAMNKKLANGKADNQILLGHHRDSMDKELKTVKKDVKHIEDLVKNSPRPGNQSTDSDDDGFFEILKRENDLSIGVNDQL